MVALWCESLFLHDDPFQGDRASVGEVTGFQEQSDPPGLRCGERDLAQGQARLPPSQGLRGRDIQIQGQGGVMGRSISAGNSEP